MIDPMTAELVATTALAVPGVAGLHDGAFGEVATYLPGRRIDGVRLRPDHCEVHLVLVWGAPVLATADAVRVAVSSITGSRVDITVQDVVLDVLDGIVPHVLMNDSGEFS